MPPPGVDADVAAAVPPNIEPDVGVAAALPAGAVEPNKDEPVAAAAAVPPKIDVVPVVALEEVAVD